MIDVEKEDEIDKSFEVSTSKSNLIKQGNELTDKIIEETDPAKLDELTQLFSLNQKKKQIARVNKISNLIELVDDEVMARLTNSPEAIEDQDLLKYWRTAQDSLIPRAEEELVLPKITVNNNTTVNVNSSGLNRASRAKVLDAVNQILGSLQNNDDNDIIDIEPNSKEDR